MMLEHAIAVSGSRSLRAADCPPSIPGKPPKNSNTDSVLKGCGFKPRRKCLKDSNADSVLKERGFKPHRKCNKINRGFSR